MSLSVVTRRVMIGLGIVGIVASILALLNLTTAPKNYTILIAAIPLLIGGVFLEIWSMGAPRPKAQPVPASAEPEPLFEPEPPPTLYMASQKPLSTIESAEEFLTDTKERARRKISTDVSQRKM